VRVDGDPSKARGWVVGGGGGQADNGAAEQTAGGLVVTSETGSLVAGLPGFRGNGCSPLDE